MGEKEKRQVLAYEKKETKLKEREREREMIGEKLLP